MNKAQVIYHAYFQYYLEEEVFPPTETSQPIRNESQFVLSMAELHSFTPLTQFFKLISRQSLF